MSDAWEEIQAIKNKRNSLREKLEKRKKERQDILGTTLLLPIASLSPNTSDSASNTSLNLKDDSKSNESLETGDLVKVDPEIEKELLKTLNEVTLQLPITSLELSITLKKAMSDRPSIPHKMVCNLLEKFATQQLINIKDFVKDTQTMIEVYFVENSKINALIVAENILADKNKVEANVKRKRDISPEKNNGDEDNRTKKDKKDPKETDILSLLAMPSTKEKENKKLGEEILDLLSKPTAKEKSLAERFRSQGGAQVMEFCPHGTKLECLRNEKDTPCKKLHFKKIIQKHTDEALGDCSFLNTCFHMDTCKYVHYEVDRSSSSSGSGQSDLHKPSVIASSEGTTTLFPPQWVQCDLRYLDMTALGKFAVIMADPPWDIHMELPYGTMSDDEMRQLGIPQLQDEGLIFLWVTGRAMELGRECLNLWGYERVDEIIWVKTNQLQRIIRTGRTGHWLNHGKEHCLVGMKGSPVHLNRGLDSDVIVAEVRATSHKPDEIYGMIERLSPGTRKIELFGRPHNIQPNWITLGNQVDGIRLIDPELIESFKRRYPDGNCMVPPSGDHAQQQQQQQ